MEMVVVVGKKRLLAFMLVALVIASQEMTTDVGVGATTCDTPFWKCESVCYKSGKCNKCCKKLGYLGGKCNFLKGMMCLCCHEDHQNASAGAGAASSASLPAPHPPAPTAGGATP